MKEKRSENERGEEDRNMDVIAKKEHEDSNPTAIKQGQKMDTWVHSAHHKTQSGTLGEGQTRRNEKQVVVICFTQRF